MRILRFPLTLFSFIFAIGLLSGQDECNDLTLVPIAIPSCSDFSPPSQIGISVPNGNRPYNISWSPNANASVEGSTFTANDDRYHVTVTDGRDQRSVMTFDLQDNFVASVERRDRYGDEVSGKIKVTVSRCDGMIVTIRRTSSPSAVIFSRTYSPGGGQIFIDEDVTPGNYSVQYTGLRPTGNTFATSNIVINDLPCSNPSVSSVSAADCGQNNGSVTINPDGGGGSDGGGVGSLGSDGEAESAGGTNKSLAQSYRWSDGVTQSDPTRNNLAAGTYGVTVSDDALSSEHCGCDQSIIVTVPGSNSFIDDPGCILGEDGRCPANNATTSRIACADDLVNGGVPLNGTAATCTDGSRPSYQWFNSIMGSPPLAINGATQEDYTIPHTPTTTSTNRRYWRKAFCACETVNDVGFSNEVVVNYSSVTVGIEPYDDDICAGTSVTLTAFEDQRGTGIDTYTWSTGQTGQTITVTPSSSRTYTVTITDGLGCSDSESAFINVSGISGFNIDHFREGSYYCEGEAVNYVIPQSRSSSVVTYTWDFDLGGSRANPNTFVGINPGPVTYNIPSSGVLDVTVRCTATENGCTTIAETFTTFYADPNITNVSTTNGDCNNPNGSLTVSWQGQSGQTAPIEFLLEGFDSGYSSAGSGAASQSRTYSNLPPGTYTLLARYSLAPRCAIEVGTYEIIGSAPIEISFPSGTGITCAGGNDGGVTAFAEGGAGGFTYRWNNGATTQTISNLSAGTYTVTATDALGCDASESITFNDPAPVTVDLISQTNVTCPGSRDGSIRVQGSDGFAPYSYRWAHGPSSSVVSSLAADRYTVTVTDNRGCEAVRSFTIDEPDAISITFPGGNAITCAGGNDGGVFAQATGGNGGFSFYRSLSVCLPRPMLLAPVKAMVPLGYAALMAPHLILSNGPMVRLQLWLRAFPQGGTP